MSDAARWRELEDLYHGALQRPPDERAAFVEDACAHDPELRSELQSLLAHDRTETDFLDQPAIGLAARELTPNEIDPSSIETGSLIGSYKILEQIARGGMGVVYRAEQQYPVHRIVALKVIKPGMDSEQVIVRFQAERQALALMDHPNIARVLDAGTTSAGRLYFVMEMVDGLPVTEYCRKHDLSLRDRLALLIPVCHAIQHAHQKGVIHRDIKPSNILVTVYDGKATPKVIDFGIAKAMHEPLTDRSMHTQAGVVIGTFEYMSPEQAGSLGEDIDTRSDIYALGAVLYQLICGSTPLNRRTLTNSSDLEIVRRIREEDPPPPSVRLGDAKLSRSVRGDLDWVVMKALEKDRTRRYETVSGLARDLQSYLAGEPVEAAPPSVSYRLRKFAHRHRVALLTAAAFIALLVGGIVVSSRQAIRASRAEQEAVAVSNFLQHDLLAQASANIQSGPSDKPDPDLKVRTALDRAAGRIAGKFDRQPEVEAAIRSTIGQTYIDLGLYPQARTQLERALELLRRSSGADDPKTLQVMSRLGDVVGRQGRFAEAEALQRQTLGICRRVLGPEHPDTLLSMQRLAVALSEQGKYAETEALVSQALEVQRRVLGPEHPDTLVSLTIMTLAYVRQGKYAQAETLYRQALEIRRRVLGDEHPDTLKSLLGLANTYYREAKYAQAETLYRQTLEIQRRVLGMEHSETLTSLNNLASAYYNEGKFAEAEAIHSQTLEIRRRVLGPEHPLTLRSMHNLAVNYYCQGKYAQAEAIHSRTLEIRRRVLGPEHVDTLASMNWLAAGYARQGKDAQAETLYRQTLEIERRVVGPERPSTLSTLSDMAAMYQYQGKYGIAENYASRALAGRRKILGPEHPDTLDSAADLALAFESQGKFAESEPLVREAVEMDRRKRPDDWQRFRAESLLGATLAGLKKYSEAEPLLLEGYRGMMDRKDRIAVPDQYQLERAHERIVQFHRVWRNP